MKKIILYSIACSLILSSCEDLLTKTLDLEEFAFEKQLAVSGSLTSTEDQFRVLVSENQSITDPLGQWSPLSDAEVSLYRDGTLVEKLSFDENSGEEGGVDSLFVVDLDNVDIVPGEYRIEVLHPDFPAANATSILPQEIPLTEISFEEDFGIAPNFLERTDAVTITFNDPPEENYYSFSIESDSIAVDTFVFLNDTTIFENPIRVSLDTNEPNIVRSSNRILFSDDFFNGTEHTITFYVTDFSEDGIVDILDILDINWSVVSKEHFEFTQSLDLYYDSQGFGPFSEAVSLFNNVEGGVGIFSALNRKLYKFP